MSCIGCVVVSVVYGGGVVGGVGCGVYALLIDYMIGRGGVVSPDAR